jgi:uncharacterized membrane protein YoaK (UPF0700 family)
VNGWLALLRLVLKSAVAEYQLPLDPTTGVEELDTTTLLARSVAHRGRAPLRPLLLLMTAALAAFCIAGGLAQDRARPHDEWSMAFTGGLGIAAMAIQNTIMRHLLQHWTPTTIMTGNLTSFTIELVHLALPSPAGGRSIGGADARRETRRRLLRSGVPLAAFVLGASLGGVLTTFVGLWSIALPTAAVGALAALPIEVRRLG